MLSSIIYESVDFVYTLARLTKRIAYGTYNWYFKKETEEQLRLRVLEERVIELEEQRHKINPIMKSV